MRRLAYGNRERILLRLIDLRIAVEKLLHINDVIRDLETHWDVRLPPRYLPDADALADTTDCLDAAIEHEYADIETHPIVAEWMKQTGKS